MKNLLFILFLFCQPLFGQQEEAIKASRQLHLALVANDNHLPSLLDKYLSYGHSNGMVETKEDLLQNLASGKMKYFDIKEDSVTSSGDLELANIRYKGAFSVLFEGKQITINLKVLEVWRKEGDQWLLFSRQAIRSI